jgi:hypothetical protein
MTRKGRPPKAPADRFAKLVITIPPALRRAVVEAAREDQRSVSSFVSVTLDYALRDRRHQERRLNPLLLRTVPGYLPARPR